MNEPSFTLTQIMEAAYEARGQTDDGDDALVIFVAKLLDIPLYNPEAMAAIRTTVLG